MVLKVKYSYSLALLLILLMGLFPKISFAQESELNPHEYHSNDTHYSSSANESLESDELIPEEEKSNSRSEVVRDSIATKYPPTNVGKSTKPRTTNDSQKGMAENQKSVEKNHDESEKEDSILSFNFLYYIFQKFKLSDIVDK